MPRSIVLAAALILSAGFAAVTAQTLAASVPAREYVYVDGRLLATEHRACPFTLEIISYIGPWDTATHSRNLITPEPSCSWTSTLAPQAWWVTRTSPPSGTGSAIVSVNASGYHTSAWSEFGKPSRNVPRSASVEAGGQRMRFLQGHAYMDPDLHFQDVFDESFRAYTGLLKHYGITTGCGSNLFCPNDPMLRAHMATFLARVVLYQENNGNTTIPEASQFETPVFPDVYYGQWWWNAVQYLGKKGLLRPRASGLFEPESNTTRAEMGEHVILIKYRNSPDFTYPARPFFTDVPETHPSFKHIQKLREQGITSGNGAPDVFDPGIAVLRFQMAIFLIRAYFTQE